MQQCPIHWAVATSHHPSGTHRCDFKSEDQREILRHIRCHIWVQNGWKHFNDDTSHAEWLQGTVPLNLLLDTAMQKLAAAAHHHQHRLSHDDALYLKYCKYVLDHHGSDGRSTGSQVSHHGAMSVLDVVSALKPKIDLKKLLRPTSAMTKPILEIWASRLGDVENEVVAESDTYVSNLIDHIGSSWKFKLFTDLPTWAPMRIAGETPLS